MRIDQEAKGSDRRQQARQVPQTRPHLRLFKAGLKEPIISWVVNKERALNTMQVLTETFMVDRSLPVTMAQLGEKVTKVLEGFFEYIGVKVLVWRYDGQHATFCECID